MKSEPELLDVLFPRVRAEILRLLFEQSHTQRYVRELMMMSGLALRTIQEELAKLTSAGLLTNWTNGYHRFYRANRAHPLFHEIRRIVQASPHLPRPKSFPKLPPRRSGK